MENEKVETIKERAIRLWKPYIEQLKKDGYFDRTEEERMIYCHFCDEDTKQKE